MGQRKALSKRVRFEVFKRDGFTCAYCGQKPPAVMLQVDHVIAVANGGTDDLANLVTACFACNNGKGATPLGDVMPPMNEMALLEGMQDAMERAAAYKSGLVAAKASRDAEDAVIREALSYWEEETGTTGQGMSIRRFLREGLDVQEMFALIESVAEKVHGGYVKRKDAWRYFCGAAWNVIRDAA